MSLSPSNEKERSLTGKLWPSYDPIYTDKSHELIKITLITKLSAFASKTPQVFQSLRYSLFKVYINKIKNNLEN